MQLQGSRKVGVTSSKKKKADEGDLGGGSMMEPFSSMLEVWGSTPNTTEPLGNS